MQASSALEAPKAQKIDELVTAHLQLQAEYDVAKKAFEASKADLILLVQKFGFTPARAEKSKRLTGVEHSLTSTVGSVIDLHSGAIEKFRSFLKLKSMLSLYRRLFVEETNYKLTQTATQEVRTLDLPTALLTKVQALFGGCFSVESKSPSLTVETIEQLNKKEAKAAKKSGLHPQIKRTERALQKKSAS